MKKLTTFFMVIVACASVVADDFNWGEFNKIKETGDDKTLIDYVESTTVNANKKEQMFYYCLAKLIVGAKKGTITKDNLESNMMTIVDNVVKDKTLAIECKLFLFFNHVAWRCGFDTNTLNNAFVKFYETNKSSFVPSNEINYYIGGCFVQIKDYNAAINYFIKAKDYYDAFYYAAYYDKGLVDSSIDGLINDTTTINTPYKLNQTIEAIGQLSNPKYDEKVKTLLIILNRKYYSYLQKGDEWKKVIVSLQLVMKSYGI